MAVIKSVLNFLVHVSLFFFENQCGKTKENIHTHTHTKKHKTKKNVLKGTECGAETFTLRNGVQLPDSNDTTLYFPLEPLLHKYNVDLVLSGVHSNIIHTFCVFFFFSFFFEFFCFGVFLKQKKCTFVCVS